MTCTIKADVGNGVLIDSNSADKTATVPVPFTP